MQSLLKVAQLWISQEGLTLPDIEYMVDKAGKLLYEYRLVVENIPISLRSPSGTNCLGATRKNGRRRDRVGALWQVGSPAGWRYVCVGRKSCRMKYDVRILKWAQS